MVMVRCPSCSKNLNVPDKYAGKRAKCPACQGTVVIPEILEIVEEDEPVEVVPVKPRKPAPRVADLDDDDDDRIAQKPTRRARPIDEEEEEEDRPRRKKRRKKTGGEWAPCPNCGCTDGVRVHWTFWGGVIAPLLINIVRCRDCGTNYNGVHGDYNTTRILIYVGFTVALALVIVAVGVVAELAK